MGIYSSGAIPLNMMPVWFICQFVVVILKAFGILTVSWAIVLMPLWVPCGAFVTFMAFIWLMCVVGGSRARR